MSPHVAAALRKPPPPPPLPQCIGETSSRNKRDLFVSHVSPKHIKPIQWDHGQIRSAWCCPSPSPVPAGASRSAASALPAAICARSLSRLMDVISVGVIYGLTTVTIESKYCSQLLCSEPCFLHLVGCLVPSETISMWMPNLCKHSNPGQPLPRLLPLTVKALEPSRSSNHRVHSQ